MRKLATIGLTTAEWPAPSLTDEPRVPAFVCHGQGDEDLGLDLTDVSGFGIDRCPTVARLKAQAECIESLCLLNAVGSQARPRPFRSKSEDIDPAAFLAPGSNGKGQHLNGDAIRAEPFRWLPGRDLLADSDVGLPAQAVVLDKCCSDELQLRPERISTGAALGPIGTDLALWTGLMELIERDTVIAAFLQRLTLPEITSLPAEIDEFLHYLRKYRLEPRILLATSDLAVPTVIAVTLDRTGVGPAVTTGTASSHSYAKAITKALLESLQGRAAFRISELECSQAEPKSPSEIFGYQDRSSYWSNCERIGELDFWLESRATVPFAELSDFRGGIAEIFTLFREREFTLYSADITLSRVRDAGFEAIKVLSPDLHPLYMSEGAKVEESRHYGEIAVAEDLPPHPFG